MVLWILKSDLKMSKASARWVPCLLSEDDGHYPASYICKLSDVVGVNNTLFLIIMQIIVLKY